LWRSIRRRFNGGAHPSTPKSRRVAGEEEAGRRFYGDLLGLPEVPKPSELAPRGGIWFRSGELEVHLGVERADFDRADRIGEFWANPNTRSFGELLINLEEEPAANAVIWGLLREMGRGSTKGSRL
jgi:hypothetical protein